MRWPWGSKAEHRQAGFTDALTNLLLQRADGGTVKASATAAVESAAGLVGRSFSTAEVSGPPEYISSLTPSCLSLIGRSLIREGGILFLINVQGGAVELAPVSSYDVEGGFSPETWRYRLTLSGPSELTTRYPVPRDSVLWIPYSVENSQPWRHIGPLGSASLAGRLSAETAAALADESSGPRGYLLPTPIAGDSPTMGKLRTDLANLRGGLATVESMGQGWQQGDGAAARSEWGVARIGSFVPQTLVNLHDVATREVLSACGLSPALWAASDGVAAREAYRQMVFSTIYPLSRILEDELQKRLHPDIHIEFKELRAADIQGRARAYSALRKGGYPARASAEAAGFAPHEGEASPPAAPIAS